MFTEKQTADLGTPLSRAHVKKNPKGFDYVEGWHAIAEANRIFGFSEWDRLTLEMRQIGDAEMVGQNWRVAYVCRVRIVVRAGQTTVTRDGTGYGSGIGKDIRDVHESASKEAETDAMKRAMMTFGNPFGLALYDKAQANVVAETEPETMEARYVREGLATIAGHVATGPLRAWWDAETPVRERMGIVKAPHNKEYWTLFDAFRARGIALSPQSAELKKAS